MIALIGGAGGIGKRYQAVLNYLDEPYTVLEIGCTAKDLYGCKKAIIATPTDLHMEWAETCIDMGITFLCEKPMSKNKEEILRLAKSGVASFVVNNWAFIATNYDNKMPSYLYYNFFNTGKDGLIWDVCQLIMLSDIAQCPLDVRTDSYWWNAKWGGQQIPYSYIEASYMQMVRAFLNDETHRLWGLNKAYRMTELCEKLEERIKNENPHWDSSSFEFDAIAGKNISTARQ